MGLYGEYSIQAAYAPVASAPAYTAIAVHGMISALTSNPAIFGSVCAAAGASGTELAHFIFNTWSYYSEAAKNAFLQYAKQGLGAALTNVKVIEIIKAQGGTLTPLSDNDPARMTSILDTVLLVNQQCAVLLPELKKAKETCEKKLSDLFELLTTSDQAKRECEGQIIATLKERYADTADMQQRIGECKAFEDVKNELGKCHEKVGKFENKRDTLEDRVDELTKKLETERLEYAKIKRQKDQYEADFSKIKSDFSKLQADLSKVNAELATANAAEAQCKADLTAKKNCVIG